jgi:putative molybdopterin biosynthesis protein
MKIRTNLAELRQKRGLSATDLAAQIGVTRQTIYSMEAGSYVPNTLVALKLARVLDVQVENLFQIEDEIPPPARSEKVELISGGEPPQAGQPVQLCRVGDQLVAACSGPVNWSLPLADGILVSPKGAARRNGKATVQLFQDEKELGKRLMMSGCDPGASVLARHLQRAGTELVMVSRNSSQSLDLLKKGLVHVAGSHLRDEASGESNLPAVRKRFGNQPVAVIAFAFWEEGLVVARGNPKSIKSVEDLVRKDLTIVNREEGAGSRMLLDSHLAKIGATGKAVRGYERVALGHLPAAWTVMTGQADCSIATRASARLFGLDFVPLVTERYDLIIREPDLDRPQIQILLDTLNRAAFRRELEGLGGYDTRTAGSRMV